jgi:hypothetical protein
VKDNETSGIETEQTLQSLFRAIVTANHEAFLRLIEKSPRLARLAVSTGATRAEAKTYFFVEISHYAYAGDTPLHMAAAAYRREIAEELVARGANVSARNRRGAEPLHYAATAFQVRHPGTRMPNMRLSPF